MSNQKVIMWIVAGLFCFALGYIGVSLYHQQHVYNLQHQAPPPLPSSK